MANKRVLVCGRNDLKLLGHRIQTLSAASRIGIQFYFVVTKFLEQHKTHQPTPSTALDRSSDGIELFLEVVNGTEGLDDFVPKRTVFQFTALST
jgi:hypothetical protein